MAVIISTDKFLLTIGILWTIKHVAISDEYMPYNGHHVDWAHNCKRFDKQKR